MAEHRAMHGVLVTAGVAGAGGTGALLRLYSSAVLSLAVPGPVATAVVNISGALLMGLLTALTATGGAWPLPASARQILLTGLLGGFTTFSLLSLETLALLQGSHWGSAVVNLLGSLVLAVSMAGLGYWLGSRSQKNRES